MARKITVEKLADMAAANEAPTCSMTTRRLHDLLALQDMTKEEVATAYAMGGETGDPFRHYIQLRVGELEAELEGRGIQVRRRW